MSVSRATISIMLSLALALTSFGMVPMAYAAPAQDAQDNQTPIIGSTITDEEIAAVLNAGLSSADSTNLLTEGEETGMIKLAGKTQYDTAAAQARYSFEKSKYAIVASGTSAVDALSATSLAGALDCPILLTEKAKLSTATKEALADLKVEEVIIVGGKGIISAEAAEEIKEVIGKEPERLAGKTLFDTQLAVYEYGKKKELWTTAAIIANGSKSFADALSISPVAFKLHAPIFLCNDDGLLPEESARVLLNAGFEYIVGVGGRAVVADKTMDIAEAAIINSGGSYGSAVRLSGTTLYDTSAEVAMWAVESEILKWDSAAFATGKAPYDALAGSVVQGRDESVLLLIDEGCYAALDAATMHAADISTVKFFGGNGAINADVRKDVLVRLTVDGFSLNNESYAITLSELAAIEVEAVAESQGYTAEEILEYLDPNNFEYGTSKFYQFADLSKGYSGMTAEQLDAFIERNVVYSEENYGVTSTLRGMGEAFVEAAKTHNVNEVYLVAHAAIESAWGCSALAQGYDYDGTIEIEGETYPEGTYYNFYGIGAYDSSPLSGGRSMAVTKGWDSCEKAIMGAAKWISYNFVNAGIATNDNGNVIASAAVSGQQNTLWKMKWDVKRAIAEGSVWHQYATSRTWATGISSVMSDFYYFSNLSIEETNLEFLIPTFEAEPEPPVEPEEPVDPEDPADPADPTEPTDPAVEPEEPADPAEPESGDDPAEPTDPESGDDPAVEPEENEDPEQPEDAEATA